MLLRDGTGFDLQSNDTTADGRRLGSAVLTAPEGFRQVEQSRGVEIISATSIDNFADSKDSYAVIVKGSQGWQVVAFTLIPSGYIEYHVLVESRYPLDGLAYSSMPDSAAGVLTFLQRARGDATMVIELYWTHNYFGPFAPS